MLREVPTTAATTAELRTRGGSVAAAEGDWIVAVEGQSVTARNCVSGIEARAALDAP